MRPSVLFAGIQKLTLLDYPDKTACTLFTTGCNFMCPFCHNPSLVCAPDGSFDEDTLIPEAEIMEFLDKRRGLLDAVCISGGEPLSQPGLAGFVHDVKQLGFCVKIDTNGSYPDVLAQLGDSGDIDYVAMDVKNSLSKYAQTIGHARCDTAPIEQSISYLLSGTVACEFRTTVVRDFHTADDLIEIATLINGCDKYYLQRFERPEAALQPGLSAYDEREMEALCERVKAVLPSTELR